MTWTIARILWKDRVILLVRWIMYYVSFDNKLRLLRIVCSLLIVLVCMVVSFVNCLITSWRTSVLRGGKVSEKSGNCPPEPIAIYSHCYVDVYQSKTKSVSDLWSSYANASIVMLMSYDQWLTMLLLMVATTLPLVGMLCSAWTITTVLWWYFVQYENWRCGSLFCI